jgi:hypothetical protein
LEQILLLVLSLEFRTREKRHEGAVPEKVSVCFSPMCICVC